MATTISRTAYNLLVDDDGTGTTGTIYSKSNVNDILTAIDAFFTGAGFAFGSNFVFSRDTADGSDSGTLYFTGGGAYDGIGSRGATFTVSGNEQSLTGNVGPGIIGMQIGNVAGSKFYILGGAAANQYMSILGADGSATFATSVSGTGWQFNASHATTPAGIDINYTAAAPNGTGSLFFRGRDTGATRIELRSNGGIANFSANNVNLSDVRTKEVAGPAGSCLALFRQVQFVNARYIDDGATPFDVMVTAQQIQQVYPDLIASFDNNKLGVKEHGLIMRGLRSIQELADKVDAIALKVGVPVL
jgi:hypothetical protein